MNNCLDTIYYLIFNFFEIGLLFQFTHLFFKPSNYNVIKSVITGLAFFTINSTTYLLYNNPILNLCTSMLGLAAYTLLFEGTVQRKIVVVLLGMLTRMFLEAVVYNALCFAIPNNNVMFMAHAIVLILLSLIVNVSDKVIKEKQSYNISLLNWLMIMITPLGSIVIVITLYLLTGNNIESIIIISILMLLNIFDFYIYEQEIKLLEVENDKNFLKIANQSYQKQLDTIQKSYNNISGIKHDMKNHMLFIHSLAENKNYDEIMSYTNTFFDNLHQEELWSHCGQPDIDSFINYKLSDFASIGAEIKCQTEFLDVSGFDNFDLIIVIGNLLDNAYRALVDTKDKRISVSLKSNKKIIYLKIINTFDTDIKKNNQIFKTTKLDKSNHGYGLWQVNSIVDKYNGILDINAMNNIFTADIMLYTNRY